MSGRKRQRKPGTTRGSPRRSRTAKASRISRRAVKSRCAHERDGWGRLSDDGPGHYNPDLSEGPWGGGVMILQGGAQSSLRPDTVRDNRCDYEAHEGRMQTGRRTAHAGSRLKPPIIGKAPLGKPAFQPYWGKPAVRNDRGDRGNVGIIRSPVRASILPDSRICSGARKTPNPASREVPNTQKRTVTVGFFRDRHRPRHLRPRNRRHRLRHHGRRGPHLHFDPHRDRGHRTGQSSH